MTFARELKQAARSLSRQPGLVVTALGTLALAIGFNTAVFSVVNSVLLEPLPFPDSDRIVRVRETVPGGQGSGDAGLATSATYYSWTDSGGSIEQVASYARGSFTIVTEDGPVGVSGGWVTPSVFPMLRATALHGRVFDETTAKPGLNRVTLIGERLWRESFGADPDLVGRVVRVEGMEVTVLGVMPRGFAFPDYDSEVWIAFVLPRPEYGTAEGSLAHPTLARLRPGFSLHEAAAEATLAANRGHMSKPSEGRRVRLVPLLEEVVADVRPALFVVTAAVGFILLIGAANLTNLFLVRAAQRRRELAVRMTLGAARKDLVRQMLGESLLLSVVGGLLGVGLAAVTTRALPGWLPADFPRIEAVSLDGTALAFAAGLALLTGIACGLFPALRAWSVDPVAALNATPTGGGDLRTASGRIQSSFIVAQVALALVLLVGAGLLIKSFSRLIEVDPGYDPANVITATLKLPGTRYTDEQRWERVREVAESLEANATVKAAGVGTGLPLSPSVMQVGIEVPDSPTRTEDIGRANLHVVRPAYAEALGLRLAQGRFLAETDTEGTTPAFVVNQAFVDAYLGEREPIGLAWPSLIEGKTWELVGVVSNVRYAGLDAEPAPDVYLSYLQTEAGDRAIRHAGAKLAIRTAGDMMSVAASLPDYVARVDPELLIGNIAAMEQRISASIAGPRLYAALLGALAALALALACLGIYGVLAYAVTQRRREIGVRLAVGAERSDILRLIYRDGLTLAGIGTLIGILGAAGLARSLSSLLFEVNPHDLATFAGVPLVLLAVAFAACAVPALRAARTDPVTSLRVD